MNKALFIILMLATTLVQAQYFDIQSGVSVPSGSFSNNTLSKNEDGFAKVGYTNSLSANYLFYKNIGVCAKFNYSTFGFNISDFSAQTNDLSTQGTTQAVTNNGKYKSASALTGIYLTLGKKQLTLDIRIMVGFLSLTRPELIYTTTYGGNSYTKTTESTQDQSAAIGYGFTAKYALPKNIYLSVNIDNINASLEFPKNNYQSSNVETTTQPFQAYLMTLGLGYRIQ
jgi:hypothetical protein